MTNYDDPDTWPPLVGRPVRLERADMTPEEIHAAVGTARLEEYLTPPRLLAVHLPSAWLLHAAWSTTARFPDGYVDAAHPQQYRSACGKWLVAAELERWAEVGHNQRCQRCVVAVGDAP